MLIIIIAIFVFFIWRNTRRQRIISPGGQLISFIAGLGLIAVIGFFLINLTGHAP